MSPQDNPTGNGAAPMTTTAPYNANHWSAEINQRQASKLLAMFADIHTDRDTLDQQYDALDARFNRLLDDYNRQQVHSEKIMGALNDMSRQIEKAQVRHANTVANLGGVVNGYESLTESYESLHRVYNDRAAFLYSLADEIFAAVGDDFSIAPYHARLIDQATALGWLPLGNAHNIACRYCGGAGAVNEFTTGAAATQSVCEACFGRKVISEERFALWEDRFRKITGIRVARDRFVTYAQDGPGADRQCRSHGDDPRDEEYERMVTDAGDLLDMLYHKHNERTAIINRVYTVGLTAEEEDAIRSASEAAINRVIDERGINLVSVGY